MRILKYRSRFKQTRRRKLDKAKSPRYESWYEDGLLYFVNTDNISIDKNLRKGYATFVYE